MATKAKTDAKPGQWKGPGPDPQMPDPKTSKYSGGWYAALAFEQSYSKPASIEDMEALERTKKKLELSKVPDRTKKRMLDYIDLGHAMKGGRFSVLQTETIVAKYLDGEIDDEHLDFEMRLMENWCGGKLRAFIESERSYISPQLSGEEKAMVERMLDLALTRSPILMVISATVLRVYHPMADESVRIDMVGKAIHMLESASTV